MDDPSTRTLPMTIHGRFWFPQNPNLVLTGDLVVSAPHRFDLNLDAPDYALEYGRHFEALVGKELPIIHGVSDQGNEITLGKCCITRASRVHKRSRAITWQKLQFFANRCLVGAHVENFENVRFGQFSVYLTGFTRWASNHDAELFNEGNGPSRVKRDDSIESFGRIAIIEVGGGRTTFGNVSHSLEYRYWRPRFHPGQSVTIDTLLDTVRNFHRLLSLLQGQTVGFDDIKAELRTGGVSDEQQSNGKENVELMVMMTGYKDPIDPPNDEMLVPLSFIANYWPNAVKVWFDWCLDRSPMLNLYFTVQLGKHLFEEHKFLFLAQALEGYHRYTYNGGWVRFIRRIEEVTQPILPLISIFISDPPQFCQDVVSVRDEFTHPGLRPSVVPKSSVAMLWRQLRTVIEICLLRDLGLPAAILERVAELHVYRR